MLFKSDLKFLENLTIVPDSKDCPQIYRGSLEFSLEHGSEKFKEMLFQISKLFENDGFKYTSVDTRTHMLMTGMYPCIPGWHCDDFYRPDNKQPDLINVEKEAPQKHYLVMLGDCSRTEFLENDLLACNPSELPKENPMYFYYDKFIEEEISRMEVKITKFVEPNKIYSFGPLAFHRGSAAKENGWRTFIRVTRSNHREPKNELRYQSNVYVSGRVSW